MRSKHWRIYGKKNARKPNPRNIGIIEQSIRQLGAARSGIVDETGVILAGNGTYEALAVAGLAKVQIVQADGHAGGSWSGPACRKSRRAFSR